MLVKLSEIIRHYLGWCPNADARPMRTAPVIATPPVNIQQSSPDGGTGGSGRIDRGAKLAMGSIKILIRNKRLLWFSLLSGLVLLFSLATNMYIEIISGTNPFPGTGFVTGAGTILIAKGSFPWLASTFVVGFISTFLTCYLLAGLIACASQILSGRIITLREGLSRAGDHIRPLAGWAVIGPLVGIGLSFVTNNYTASLPTILISMGITVVFGALTMFVVPAIVLSEEGLFPAILKSIVMFRKLWGEIIVCAGIFFLIVFGIYLVAMVPIIMIGFSSGSTALVVVAIILAMLVMMVILFIGSTIVGIATFGLYTYGTTDRIPGLYTEIPGSERTS
nr:DUF6159 family protein [uncultured Methanoregula sp.]